uniref:Uncharacterized protein n=1 Tax=Sphaerodactylus townsendi TaxID=933632 RepID=A0ACB8F1V8_9SAUR
MSGAGSEADMYLDVEKRSRVISLLLEPDYGQRAQGLSHSFLDIAALSIRTVCIPQRAAVQFGMPHPMGLIFHCLCVTLEEGSAAGRVRGGRKENSGHLSPK